MNISLKQVEQVALPRYNLKNLEDLYSGIGSGDIRLNQLVNFLQNRLIKVTAEEADQEILRHVASKSANAAQQKAQQKADQQQKKGYVIVEGVGNLLHHMARLLPTYSWRCNRRLHYYGTWHLNSSLRL